jgi:anti-sigma regulatory factor (Ser/Thr protein kinase)
MPGLEKKMAIRSRDFLRAGDVSMQIQGLLKNIGFRSDLIRRAAICAYEAEMNVVMHGGDGFLVVKLDPREIVLEVEDNGQGIEDIDMAMREGYSTASPGDRERGFGAGMGLPNIKRNADSLEVQSEVGRGTRLRMRFAVDDHDAG